MALQGRIVFEPFATNGGHARHQVSPQEMVEEGHRVGTVPEITPLTAFSAPFVTFRQYWLWGGAPPASRTSRYPAPARHGTTVTPAKATSGWGRVWGEWSAASPSQPIRWGGGGGMLAGRRQPAPIAASNCSPPKVFARMSIEAKTSMARIWSRHASDI